MTCDTHNGLIRITTYPAQYVLDIINKIEDIDQYPCRSLYIELGDIQVKVSKRVMTFVTKGLVCVTCGVTGTFFAVERWPHRHNVAWHINLYGHREDGTEVLLTKDHIVPASKGGKDHLDNLQPMCKRCNENKGDQC